MPKVRVGVSQECLEDVVVSSVEARFRESESASETAGYVLCAVGCSRKERNCDVCGSAVDGRGGGTLATPI